MTSIKTLIVMVIMTFCSLLLSSCSSNVSETSYPLYDVRNLETQEEVHYEISYPEEFVSVPVTSDMFGSETPFEGILEVFVSPDAPEVFRVDFSLQAEDPQAAVESLKEYIRLLDRLDIHSQCVTINEAKGMANLTLEVAME